MPPFLNNSSGKAPAFFLATLNKYKPQMFQEYSRLSNGKNTVDVDFLTLAQSGVEPPDPGFLKIHAALAKVLDLCDAAQHVGDIEMEVEGNETLRSDGHTDFGVLLADKRVEHGAQERRRVSPSSVISAERSSQNKRHCMPPSQPRLLRQRRVLGLSLSELNGLCALRGQQGDLICRAGPRRRTLLARNATSSSSYA
ncbi:hypothetical protein HWV62_1981 [Athelia sp. TMB]|nr:hypothetical protein HWV62_1981 [Athelia sp. TMB]